MLMRSGLALSLFLAAGCTAHSEGSKKDLSAVGAGSLQSVIAGDHRSAENKARDPYRHPAETLEFFGLEKDMTVVEIAPGGGWYTEILAPYLKDEGKLYAAHFDANSEREYYRNSRKKFDALLAANPEAFEKVEVTVFEPPKHVAIAPPGSADMVLTFRNVHSWMGAGAASDAFKAFHTALKPGGILGVVEHRAAPEAPAGATSPTGYVPESQVIQFAKDAGFELVEKSEINANPKDTRDHPKGVWTLPPSYRLGDVDRAKYQAIGESDRMTLKFRKPE